MIWYIVTFAVILLGSNLFWFMLLLRFIDSATDTQKLIASKTVSEYSWLKKAESTANQPPKPSPGYHSVWEEEDERQGV